MTGWRIGYIAADERVSDALNRIHQYLTVCGVSFAQKGAVGVLNHKGVEAYLMEMRQAFAKRLKVWNDAFSDNQLLRYKIPNGAFYIFPNVDFRGYTGREFCKYMLEKYYVAMVPGEIFGENYMNHVRISYGRDIDIQKEAVRRLLKVLKDG